MAKAEKWKFDEIGAKEGCPRVTDMDENPIADLRGWGYLTGTGGLNLPLEQAVAIQDYRGRLIAAAPDLLAELKHLIALIEPLERDGRLNVPGLATLNGARAAVARAEGKVSE